MKLTRNYQALLITGLALLGTTPAFHTARAEIVTQTMQSVTVDVQKLSTGYRASKIIGASVMNDSDETIGKIDDLIVNPEDNKTAFVIISVGGWLGMGKHMIALPYDNLRISSNKTVLPGATKDGLKSLMKFEYRTE